MISHADESFIRRCVGIWSGLNCTEENPEAVSEFLLMILLWGLEMQTTAFIVIEDVFFDIITACMTILYLFIYSFIQAL